MNRRVAIISNYVDLAQSQIMPCSKGVRNEPLGQSILGRKVTRAVHYDPELPQSLRYYTKPVMILAKI